MQQITEAIADLYKQWSGQSPDRIELLPQAGSDRRYFRVFEKNDSVIATYGINIAENETFLYFNEQFVQRQLPVPKVWAVSEDRTLYLQEDLGDLSLLNCLENNGYTQENYGLFKESLKELARLQVVGHENMNYDRCLTNHEFGRQAILADLLYFKYYFLDALRKPYDKQQLIEDFEALSTYLTHTEFKYFMFRDFQSRNIMVKSDRSVGFIDYQGGMKGAPQYDVASLLWQAKANLPDEWKVSLLEDYMDAFENQIGKQLNRNTFKVQYNGYVLIRLLQVLGAYGFRGLFERKAHFLSSIPQALKNLKWFVSNQDLGIALPEFKKILEVCVSDEIIDRFTTLKANTDTPLIVKVHSFSFRKGIPADPSENGGGYVFDCRGILNPGRLEPYKKLTGRDKPVKDFLEQQTRMPEFLNSVFDLIDISVEDYIRRGFANLMVNFGCTGGQHRSVYAADAVARHLRNKFNVKVELLHIEQESKNWINE